VDTESASVEHARSARERIEERFISDTFQKGWRTLSDSRFAWNP